MIGEKITPWILMTLMVLLISPNLFAQFGSKSRTYARYPNIRIFARYDQFQSNDKSLFNDGDKELSGGISYMPNAEYLVPSIGISYGAQEGQTFFKFSGNNYQARYFHEVVNLELGLLWYPMKRKTNGANIYLHAHAMSGYHMIELNKKAIPVNAPSSDRNFSWGYEGGLGIDWTTKSSDYSNKYFSRFGYFLEIGLKKENVLLLKENSNNNSLFFKAGIGW